MESLIGPKNFLSTERWIYWKLSTVTIVYLFSFCSTTVIYLYRARVIFNSSIFIVNYSKIKKKNSFLLLDLKHLKHYSGRILSKFVICIIWNHIFPFGFSIESTNPWNALWDVVGPGKSRRPHQHHRVCVCLVVWGLNRNRFRVLKCKRYNYIWSIYLHLVMRIRLRLIPRHS